jgi:hypothetical protein
MHWSEALGAGSLRQGVTHKNFAFAAIISVAPLIGDLDNSS